MSANKLEIIQTVSSMSSALVIVRESFLTMLKMVPIEARGTLLSSMFVNTITVIDDEEWRSIRHHMVTPCGDQNCQCHITNAPLFEWLDEQRDEAKAMLSELGEKQSG